MAFTSPHGESDTTATCAGKIVPRRTTPGGESLPAGTSSTNMFREVAMRVMAKCNLDKPHRAYYVPSFISRQDKKDEAQEKEKSKKKIHCRSRNNARNTPNPSTEQPKTALFVKQPSGLTAVQYETTRPAFQPLTVIVEEWGCVDDAATADNDCDEDDGDLTTSLLAMHQSPGLMRPPKAYRAERARLKKEANLYDVDQYREWRADIRGYATNHDVRAWEKVKSSRKASRWFGV